MITEEREADTINFDSIPSVPKFRAWKLAFRKKVAGSSRYPQKAFLWISAIEAASSIEDLQDDEGFETLSAKVGAGLSSLVHGELERQISVLEEKMAHEGRMMNDRQITW